ncbi:GyrI-like domain-containing protein [Peredibacter starrii]|uniref:GyrI-like domain-containing protein n=1 Tax=Peredibacter starrii TaxID=28202 RepID=A0AAX4HU41_9BACT|nr:GyrI-like domain-containing protein [Peredibacter starrii]WPU66702.1 GyrI-like domain-containing protein [Peredibacter starrii]
MLMKIGLGVVAVLIGFPGYVSTREGKFRYERSGVINATPEKNFPYLSDFKLGGEWSPFEQVDPNMKKTFTGNVMEFEGNKDAGSGRLELLNTVPNQSVDIKLTMLKPFHAENLVQYKLTPEQNGTRFTWIMSGDGGFMGKLMNVFMDCEKMIGDQFLKGISNLKSVVEGKNMNLTEKPEIVTWPETHYVFVEKTGPFQETAQPAWESLHKNVPNIKSVKGFMSLYKVEPKMVYRAGAMVAVKPDQVPAGLAHVKFEGGKYAKFTLIGAYENLPEASGKVFEIIKRDHMNLRDAFFIENYVNDPATTPADKLVTEILVPIQ